MPDSSLQRRTRGLSPVDAASRYFFLLFLSGLALIMSYTAAITALYNPETATSSQYVSRSDAARSIFLEGLHNAAGPLARSLPPASGIAVARINARLMLNKPFPFHCIVGFLTFCIIGYIAGRYQLSSGALFLPVLSFWLTYAYLDGSFLRLVPLSTFPMLAVLIVQMCGAYACALWSKWNNIG